MKSKVFLIFGIFFSILSLCLVLYPTVSNWVNSSFSDKAIDGYTEKVSTLAAEEKENYIVEATEYNEQLKEQVTEFSFSEKNVVADYDEILSFEGGIIGYVEIPVIKVNLPIYHGTQEDALRKGAAHLPNTAFPVGGKGNHTVLAAHTGSSRQIYFDDVDELVLGDLIYIKILDNTYVYKVVDRNIVIPTDTSKCMPDKDRDLLSLVTCYPYSQNTHRLIVTAERVEEMTSTSATEFSNTKIVVFESTVMNSTGDEIISDESNKPQPIYYYICVPLIALVIIVLIINKRKKEREEIKNA